MFTHMSFQTVQHCLILNLKLLLTALLSFLFSPFLAVEREELHRVSSAQRAGVQQACQLQELLAESQLSVGPESVRVPRFAWWDRRRTPKHISSHMHEKRVGFLVCPSQGCFFSFSFLHFWLYMAFILDLMDTIWWHFITKQSLMLWDAVVLTVMNDSTDIQTRWEYLNRYLLIFTIRICTLHIVLYIWFKRSIWYLQRCTFKMSSWWCLSGLAVHLVCSPSTPPFPLCWLWLILKNLCCHFIHNFQFVKSCRLRACCSRGSCKSVCVCVYFCLTLERESWYDSPTQNAYMCPHALAHIHLNEHPPYFCEKHLLTGNLDSKNHSISLKQISADSTPAKSVTATHTHRVLNL